MKLTFEHLSKNYGTKQALKDICMTLTDGIYGILGPNGAGKSTMMNILTGNLTQLSGRILFNGKDIRTLGTSFRAILGYMPQQQAFYPGFTTEQFLYYIASLRDMDKIQARERIDWALKLLGLSDMKKKRVRSLSGGMKQRLLLAQAILADPDILVLDEPTAGLDPKQRIAVRNLISEISLHKIVLVSTHVVQDVEYVAKEILLISDGTLIRQGTAQELTEELRGQVWEAIVPDEEVRNMGKYGIVCNVARAGNNVSVRFLSMTRPAVFCTKAEPTLEDVYLHYFGDLGDL